MIVPGFFASIANPPHPLAEAAFAGVGLISVHAPEAMLYL